MSYANGIGGPQQGSNTVATTAASEPQQPVSAAKPSVAASGATVQHADQTSLSAAGGLVSQALEGSDVRADKVASIQQAIANGTYNVASSAVADKIIQSLLE